MTLKSFDNLAVKLIVTFLGSMVFLRKEDCKQLKSKEKRYIQNLLKSTLILALHTHPIVPSFFLDQYNYA